MLWQLEKLLESLLFSINSFSDHVGQEWLKVIVLIDGDHQVFKVDLVLRLMRVDLSAFLLSLPLCLLLLLLTNQVVVSAHSVNGLLAQEDQGLLDEESLYLILKLGKRALPLRFLLLLHTLEALNGLLLAV